MLSDDHAAHAIGTYGSVVNRTPHIDAIAAAGVRLDNLFATNSLCAPSRASILTGTYSHVNGVTTLDTPIDAAQSTFVTALREAGYRTAFVGKWHMGQGSTDGVDHDPQGFDRWDALIDQGEYHDPRFLSPDGLRVEEGYATELITDLAIDWVESLDPSDGDAPWCVLVWHKAPHRPWEPDAAHAGLYAVGGAGADGSIPVPATFTDDLAGRSDTARRAAMRIADHLTAEDLKQPVPPRALGRRGGVVEVPALHGGLPRLRRVRRRQRRAGHRVARASAVTSTTRSSSTPPTRASSSATTAGSTSASCTRSRSGCRSSCPIRARCRPGSRSTGSSPTSTSHRRCSTPPGWTCRSGCRGGRSGAISRIRSGAQRDRETEGFYYRYWMHDDGSHQVGAHYGYRTHRHTLIFFYNDGLGLPGCSDRRFDQEWELYDLEADPEELVNVADDPAYAAVRADLEARMWLAQKELGDEPHPDQPVPRLAR